MPARIPPLQISAYTATSAVGVGKEPLAEALEHSRSGLRANDFGPAPLPTVVTVCGPLLPAFTFR